MLHIYPVAIEVLQDIRPLAERIAQFDKDQARQLKRSPIPDLTARLRQIIGTLVRVTL